MGRFYHRSGWISIDGLDRKTIRVDNQRRREPIAFLPVRWRMRSLSRSVDFLDRPESYRQASQNSQRLADECNKGVYLHSFSGRRHTAPYRHQPKPGREELLG